MKKLICIAALLMLFTSLFAEARQAQSYKDRYSTISGEGIGLYGTKESTTKSVQLNILSAMVSFRLNPAAPSVRLRSYFSEQSEKRNFTQSIGKGIDRDVSINIGQNFVIELLDPKTDTLIKVYSISRPRIYPVIVLEIFKAEDKRPYKKLRFDQSGELEVPAGQRLKVNHQFPHPSVDQSKTVLNYSLINLRTRKKVQGRGTEAIMLPELTAGHTYEFRANYDLQPESLVIGYISVKPHWYRSVYMYTAALLLLAFGLYLLNSIRLNNKLRQERRKQEALEASALRLQAVLNPHFTFNAMSSIQGLMNTGRIDEANQYLEDFSSLLRKSLSKSRELYSSLDQELEMMRMYIRLEALRFNFSWNIEVEDLDATSIEIPTLILQPFIENSIKHGLSCRRERGQLIIHCRPGEDGRSLEILIRDNGQWIERESGHGLSISAERIQTLNKMNKERKIVFNFVHEAGTTARLTFENWIES